jgi:hypothetical protein
MIPNYQLKKCYEAVPALQAREPLNIAKKNVGCGTAENGFFFLIQSLIIVKFQKNKMEKWDILFFSSPHKN